ncbi:zinc ribbon domain-containing protein [Nonomuraea sp. NPDC046802]|uniref:zinc ribbon domain-containing protein n=1 Tax=Nonomuraea sp. NPDC046802 TaxID=3154919 RepID=UPI0033FCC414
MRYPDGRVAAGHRAYRSAHTSQECSACEHTERANRPGQETFLCTSCGFAGARRRQRSP